MFEIRMFGHTLDHSAEHKKGSNEAKDILSKFGDIARGIQYVAVLWHYSKLPEYKMLVSSAQIERE